MSAWTQRQQALFFDLLDNGWPGDLTPGQVKAYQTLLDGTDPEVVVAGLRRLLHRGQRFRPSAAELLGAANHDPSRPTFDEAYRLIFGARGILAARPTVRNYTDIGDRAAAYRTAARERAASMHPLVGAFVERQGLDRLRGLDLTNPQWGAKRRDDLKTAWEEHVEAFEGREVAALASGEGREGLRRLDPLAGLGVPRPQLEPTTGGTR